MKLKLSWKVLAAVNLILGLLLWFLFFSDYSLIGNIPDIIFPPLVGIIAVISLFSIKTSDKRQRLLVRLAHLPAIIGGVLSLLIGFIMLIPPYTFAALLMISDIRNDTQIQQVVSPDGTQSAYIYFREPIIDGNGSIDVRTRYSILPFIERDLLNFGLKKAITNSTNYVEWHGNDTLYILQNGQEISTSGIKAEVPELIDFLYSMVRYGVE